MPIGSSYPGMMCMERCLAQLSTLHSKKPFFKLRESHPELGPHSLPKNTLLPLPRHRPPAPSCALLPLATVQVLHVAVAGRLKVPPPLSSLDTCFPAGLGCVSVGMVEQRTGGVQWTGQGSRLPPGIAAYKRARALSHGLLGNACVHL